MDSRQTLGRPEFCSLDMMSRNQRLQLSNYHVLYVWKALELLCLRWQNLVHKWYSSIKTSLRNCEDFVCKTCSTTTGAVDPSLTCVTINRDEIEIVSEFYYLGDVIGQAGECTDAVLDQLGRLFTDFYQYSQPKV